MLRIVFTGLVTCVLLLAAGVRFAREDAPRNVREKLAAALERSVESATQALPRPAGQTALDATPRRADPVLSAAPPAPPVSKPTPLPAAAVARTPTREIETGTEERISPLWSAPFVESSEAELEAERDGDPEPEQRQLPLVAAAPSQDEWAGLIRRMLAIYQRMDVGE